MSTAHAATPEQRCQSAKNKAAGKYVVCRQSTEAKLATTPGDPIDLQKYSNALAKCATVYNRGWQKAIDKATSAGAVCPDAPLTAADFQAVIDDHTDNIATGLADGSLTHYQNNLDGQSCASLGGLAHASRSRRAWELSAQRWCAMSGGCRSKDRTISRACAASARSLRSRATPC